MEHEDHVALLKDGIAEPGGVWADLGSGTGAFTLALADLIGPKGEVYSVDKDARALRQQESAVRARFPHLRAHYRVADFVQPLDLPMLDGIVMANALHYVREKDPVVQMLRDYLKPGGRLLIVEYNADRGNVWVPHPFSYRTWEKIAGRNGFISTRLLAARPSMFLGSIYSALSISGI